MSVPPAGVPAGGRTEEPPREPAGEAPGGAEQFVPRFSLATRAWHWSFALLFLALLLTGLTNFWPEAKAMQVGGERLFALTHVVAGFAMLLALPLLGLALLARSGAFRRDIAEAARFGVADYVWLQQQALRATGSDAPLPRAGKLNGGQKVNAWAVGLLTAGLLVTGLVLGVHWFSKDVFEVAFVERLFPWHTALALLSLPLIAGHLYFALLHPGTREALRGITLGRVRRSWAERHHPAWRPDGE